MNNAIKLQENFMVAKANPYATTIYILFYEKNIKNAKAFY